MNVRAIIPLLVIICTACCLARAGASASIEFENTTLDLGKVVQGAEVKASQPFKNIGSETLEILQVTTGCDCADAKSSASKIEPGAAASIDVSFRTSGLKGEIAKTITVVSNDPVRPVVELKLRGEVITIATLSPERLNFGTIKAGSSLEKVLLVTPEDPKKFGISKVEAVGSHVSVREIVKPKCCKGPYSITMIIAAGKAPGRVLEKLKIVTSLPDKPVLEFLIFGNVEKQAGGDGPGS